jgi:methionyl-tRNA formyltransferase
MEKDDLKIVFMGTPDFALPSLRMLHKEGFRMAAVFTQPDRQTGRGHKMLPPPVKLLAEELSIPVFQFEKVRRPEGVEVLKNLAPDLLVTAAYGQILTQEILNIPRFGCINVHGSLLPRLRGAAPVQWAIINGEKKTGVTTMMTVLALDAGDMLEKDEIEIPEDITAGELYAQLSVLGTRTLRRTLNKLLAGTLVRTPQDESEATYFPMFKKGFGEIDFNQPCRKIKDFIRGTNPAPGAYMMLSDNKIKVFKVSCKPDETGKTPGEILFADQKTGLGIAAADGMVLIEELQWPGKSKTTSKELLRGRSIQTGIVITRRDTD